jgi:hypothetical protein
MEEKKNATNQNERKDPLVKNNQEITNETSEIKTTKKWETKVVFVQ